MIDSLFLLVKLLKRMFYNKGYCVEAKISKHKPREQRTCRQNTSVSLLGLEGRYTRREEEEECSSTIHEQCFHLY